MAARASMRHAEFDASCEFVAVPPVGRQALSVGGREYAYGEQVDKSAIEPRRLRQMYDQRLIAYAPGFAPGGAEKKRRPLAVGPTDTEFPGECGRFRAAPPKAASKKKVARVRSRRAA